MKEFKIKMPHDLYEMLQKIEPNNLDSCRDVIDYIGHLESNLSTYQMALDNIRTSIDYHNQNVTR